ncbi:hypothetical protein J2S43_000633 [Catenuloplanes nepalensis]|uniref:Transcriptional regulator n=1 Tax=Catenuloplanes nepalensis TaxID=587533 RepID=A0ABT9MLD1_9ACTN|nr:hypothetical protein [Catenuloplanes nepalensis]MDP9792121.1 hypothetical protein [Catenuloplanes nepalensis]
MTDKLNPSETALLLLLMSEMREISNTELTKNYGELKKPSRDKLNRLGYLESRKEGRTFVHALGDKGWVLLESDLRFPGSTPKILGSALAAFHAVMRDRVLPRTQFATFGEALAQSPVLPAQRAEPEPAQAQAPVEKDDLGERIRNVYASLASGAGAWVSLAGLRQHFTDVPRAALDEALKQLSREDGVHLAPEDNQKTLTAEERDAALRSGGQDKHLLAIGV